MKPSLLNKHVSVVLIVGCSIMRERGTNQARGFGFCDYMEPWQVEKALQILHKQLFRGRPLRFDRVSNKKVYFELLSTILQVILQNTLFHTTKNCFVCVLQSESVRQYVQSLPHHELWDILLQFQVSSVDNSANSMIPSATEWYSAAKLWHVCHESGHTIVWPTINTGDAQDSRLRKDQAVAARKAANRTGVAARADRARHSGIPNSARSVGARACREKDVDRRAGGPVVKTNLSMLFP